MRTDDVIRTEADKNLQVEFNQWAEAGRGDEMESHHSDITEQTIALMDLPPQHAKPASGTRDFDFKYRLLDLGCGTGWASRRLARLVPQGEVVGVDVADEMLRRAAIASAGIPNVRYVWGSSESLPFESGYFNRVLSVESFYYYADQGKALDELYRVMAPGGKLFILINLYTDNPYSLRWTAELKVPVHQRSQAEYVKLIQNRGFTEVEAVRIPDRSPSPDVYSGKWFRNADELKHFKAIGALLLIAKK